MSIIPDFNTSKNQERSIKLSRKLALSVKYISPNQLTLDEFETPFNQKLIKENIRIQLKTSDTM